MRQEANCDCQPRDLRVGRDDGRKSLVCFLQLFAHLEYVVVRSGSPQSARRLLHRIGFARRRFSAAIRCIRLAKVELGDLVIIATAAKHV